jgi:hypothetical protein
MTRTITRRSFIGHSGLVFGFSTIAGTWMGAAQGKQGLKRIEARIRFMTTRDGPSTQRGWETVSYDFHGDGLITLRAHSVSNDPEVIRDVIYTLSPDYLPLETFLRIQVEGRYEGSGWFRFTEGLAESEVFNVKTGRSNQRIPLEGRVNAFVAHPVSTDVLISAAFNHDDASAVQQLPNVFLSSTDPYGRTGPVLAPSESTIEYLGREKLDTPAGQQDADHYVLHAKLGATDGSLKPFEDLWCLAGTGVFLRAHARPPFDTTYELETLSFY